MRSKKIFKPLQQQHQERRGYLSQQQAQSWIAVGTVVVGAAGTAIGGAQQAKAAKSAAAAGQGSAVDIASLDQQARDLAKRNASDSAALEQQYAPEVAALRRQATEALLPYAQGTDAASSTSQALRTGLYGDFNGASNNPLARSSLLDESVARARADLALGGTLDRSTRNEVTRRAASTAGAVGGGGLGLGRDLSARDLGISSNQLLNQRLANAAGLSSQDQAFNNAAANFGLQNTAQRLSTASLISDLGQQDFNRRFGLAQFGQSIARPEVGLTPSSLVDLTVGNSNARTAAAQNAAAVQAQSGNALMGLGGGLIGTGAGLYANQATKTGGTTNTGGSSATVQSGGLTRR